MGHLGDPAKVAGVGMANMFINMVAQSLILGGNYAVCTFVSQAYGAGNMRLVGVYRNKGRVMIMLIFIPILLAMLCCENFMLWIG